MKANTSSAPPESSNQELEGAEAEITGLPGHPQGRCTGDPITQLRRERRAGSHLNQLLVAPLQGAVALSQVDNILAVAHDLHLDVPRSDHDPLNVDLAAPNAAGASDRHRA